MSTQRKSQATDNGKEDKAFTVDLPRRAFRRVKRQAPLHTPQLGKEEMMQRMRRFGPFAKLPARVLSELAAAASVRAFRAGEFIWRANDTVNSAMFIEQGFVKGVRRTGDGISRTYGLYGPGDSMGIFAIWAGMAYPTDAIAMNDGMAAIFVDAGAILKFAEKYPRLAGALRDEIGNFAKALIRKIEIISAGAVPQRLAALMTMLIDRYGVDVKDNTAHLPITLTLEQISEIVSVRLETVARAMSSWKRQGWLTIDANGCHFACLDKVRGLLSA